MIMDPFCLAEIADHQRKHHRVDHQTQRGRASRTVRKRTHHTTQDLIRQLVGHGIRDNEERKRKQKKTDKGLAHFSLRCETLLHAHDRINPPWHSLQDIRYRHCASCHNGRVKGCSLTDNHDGGDQ